MQVLRAFGGALFPECRCLVCGEPRKLAPGDALCGHCMADLHEHAILPYACPNCLSPVRSGSACGFCVSGGMNGLDKAYAPYYYGGAVQRLVVQLKFGPVAIAATPLAAGMVDSLGSARADALVPVPLHKQGLRERGFNQAAMLCDQIASVTGMPVLHALIKIRVTRRQSSLPAAEREANVRDAYALSAPVNGMRLLLVDDVRTTGSTLRACAQVLREAGASSVSVLTAAVAPQHDVAEAEAP